MVEHTNLQAAKENTIHIYAYIYIHIYVWNVNIPNCMTLKIAVKIALKHIYQFDK